MSDAALPIAVDLIARFEGFRSEPYQDEGGRWTIGYGFTYLPDSTRVSANTPAMSEDDARSYLTVMAARVMANVRAMVHGQPTDNQIAALTSFAYNEGTGALRGSTLLELLNKGDVQGAANQFGAWVYAGGHVSDGLRNRRAEERALFLTPAVSADDLNAAELEQVQT